MDSDTKKLPIFGKAIDSLLHFCLIILLTSEVIIKVALSPKNVDFLIQSNDTS